MKTKGKATSRAAEMKFTRRTAKCTEATGETRTYLKNEKHDLHW